MKTDARAVARVVVGLIALVAIFAALGTWARAPIEAFSRDVVTRLGLGGIFLAVAALDPVPIVGFQPFVIFGAAGGLPLGPLFAVAWAGSCVGSVVAWSLGAWVGSGPRVHAALARVQIDRPLRERSSLTLAVAAVGPLPFGLATFGAGAVGAPLRSALIGAAARGVKIGLSVAAVAMGWSLGAGP